MNSFVNITDVCSEIFAGGDAPKSNMSESKTDAYRIPIFSNGEANDGLYGYTNFARVTQPSITVSARGTIGFVAVRNEPFVPIVRLISLTPDPEKIEIRYLYYAIQNYKFDGSGTSIPQLTVPMLKKYSFPLPTKEQQLAIIDQLDNVCNLISLRKQQLSKLDELVKSRFIEMFGDPNIEFKYESYKFKEFASDMTKGPFGSDMKKDLFVPKGEDTYKVYIQANAIQSDQNIGDYYISKEYFDSKIFRFEVHPGDYIITCDGTLGKHLKLNDEMEKGVISPSLLRLTLNEEKITSEYFEYLWDLYMLLLMKKEARNACLVHLPSAKVIGEIDIPFPPFTMQKEFSKFVHYTDKSKLEIQKSLEKLETLKKALMQKYFG